MNEKLEIMGKAAKKAAKFLMSVGTKEKNDALLKIADALLENADIICEENKKDILVAKQKNTSDAMIDRLTLTFDRIKGIADGVRKVADLPDPIGEVMSMTKRPNGIVVGKKRVPIGVIGIIYESRPNVTVDTAALCLKSSNAVVLKGGSDAINSNRIIVKIMNDVLKKCGWDCGVISFVDDTSRETAKELMQLNDYIDLLIPRGGAGLIKTVVNTATIPVIETGTGNCHAYVDRDCDFDMAIDIIINGKTSRPSVCNALESVIINKNIDKSFYTMLEDALISKNVEIRACDETLKYMKSAKKATQEDFYTEFLDYIISVKSVNNIDEAIDEIYKHSTRHSEVIITNDYANANKFLNEVDSAAVYVNASTRFTDGFEFGFGAEIGISTQKMHARGPMGLTELTSYKYIIYGDGQIR